MGLLTRKLGINMLSLEDPAQPLLPYSALFESLGLGKSDAGVLVNEKQAMRLTTAFACINIISTDLSTIPFGVFQKMPDGSVREATEHRLYGMLHDQPNSKMSSTTFRGAILASVLGWGNGYAFIRRDKAARPLSLEMLPSDRTCPALVDGQLIYITTATKDGMPESIDPQNMLHITGLTMDGLVGLSPIGTCKNAFGLAIAAEKFGAQFFGNGSRATGVFTHPGELDAEAYENIKKSIREQATGESALRPLILEEGMQWEQMTIAPNDAQFLQTRQFQRVEIAALYRVAMHLLQDLQRATNNNIEHQSLDHLRYTLRPWAVRLEQEVDRKLLSGPFQSQHDFNEFQRGDYASQTAGLQTLRNIGVYSANDCLRVLRQNPIPAAEGGDVRLAPVNMVPLDSLVSGDAPDPSAPDDETADSDEGLPVTDRGRGAIIQAFRRIFRDAVGRVANRKQHDAQFAYRALQPIVASVAEAILALKFSGSLMEQDHAVVKEWAEILAARSESWAQSDASAVSTQITGETYDALSKALMGGA